MPPRFRQVLVAPTRLNEIWAMDFMHDALYGGRRFRTLNILDEGNREGLAIEVGTSIPATRVIRVLGQLIALYGQPDRLPPGQRPRADVASPHRVVRPARHRFAVHPARQAGAECLH